MHTQGSKTGAGSLSVSYSVDNTAPVVSNISSPNSSGNYIAGDELTINVAFSEAVVVTGTPTLTLDAGTRDATVSYVSGGGTSTLVFKYVVATGDLKDLLDIKETASLSAGSGTIKDRVGNSAVLTLPTPGSATSLRGSKSLAIDGVVPAKPTVLTAAGVDGITLDWLDNTETDLKEYRIYSCSGLVASSCASLTSFSSLSSVGWPVATSASTPKAITVGKPS